MSQLLKNRVKEAQPKLSQQFEKVVKNNKLTHAYLIESQDNHLSYEFSLWLAQNVFCVQPDEGLACGVCDNCRRIESFDFPDVNMIEPDGQTIKVDQIREIKQTFVRSGMESSKKALIIKEADKMSVSAANSLLKFIEEPDGTMYIFFLTNNINKMLATIQSRCQQVYLMPVSKESIISELKLDDNLGENQIRLLAELADSKEKAVELSNDEWFNSAREAVIKWFNYLDKQNPLSFVYVQQNLVKLTKEKNQQFMILDILLVLYRLKLKTAIKKQESEQQKIAQSIELIVKARQKMEANVSFQNVCEQLVWQLLY